MNWITQTLWWYVCLLGLGLVSIPFTKRVFGKNFFDFGYSFAKTITLIFVTYSALTLGVMRIVPFTQSGLLFIVGAFGLLNILIFRHKKKEKKKGSPLNMNQIGLIVFEEVLFLVCLFVWVIVRGQEPSIHGLEKFMDFGFINSILRSTYFPPKDMWLAGHSINYYYFGHLSGAVLTKLSNIPSNYTYNLILASIFALGVTQTFSLCFNVIHQIHKKIKISFIAGVIGAFLLNFAGNLHTIYAFTAGYQGDKAPEFWKILTKFTPQSYWYQNATRFIPFTIHEFPIYSYVVADLHGHVFDIPFVLLTLAVLYILIINGIPKRPIFHHPFSTLYPYIPTLALAFLCAVHYMTNAFDGPIYMLISMVIHLFLLKDLKKLFVHILVLGIGFIAFTIPFAINFVPFVSGIGVNCAPKFLVQYGKIGPFLFEKGNCQTSQVWMLAVLWGFFIFNFAFFVLKLLHERKNEGSAQTKTDYFIMILFMVSTILLIVPEFFYIKDIYPAHFRANTMFKLEYQAFIMMSVASTYTFIRLKQGIRVKDPISIVYLVLFAPLFFLVAIYPTFAIGSYYGTLKKTPQLNGSLWVNDSYPNYVRMIDFMNKNVSDQPTILEAQGDSYTDFNVVSAYTGIPTVGGWWVHEWLWRGSAEVIGKLIPDIQNIYESADMDLTKNLIKKFDIKYIIVGPNEHKKYTNLDDKKIRSLGKVVFETKSGIDVQTSYIVKIL